MLGLAMMAAAVAAAAGLPGLDRLQEAGLTLEELHALPSDIQNSWLAEIGVPIKHRRALLRVPEKSSTEERAAAKPLARNLRSSPNKTHAQLLMSELPLSSLLPPTTSAGSRAVEVKVQLVLQQILDVNTRDGSLELQGFLRQYWSDPRLVWDDARGVRQLYLTRHEVWHPDTRIYEQQMSGSDDSGELSAEGITVEPTGACFMSRPFTARLACPMQLESYPFDTQHCSFTIGSWMYSSEQVDTDARPAPPSFWRHPDRQDLDVPADEGAAARVPPSAPVDLSHYFPLLGGSEFDLTGIRAVTQRRQYGCCADSFSVVVIELELKRGVMTVAFGLVLPIIFVTMAGFLSLFMPAPISGARPALSVTVMLTTATVYLVASRLAPQSNSSSVMSRLYVTAFSINFVLVFLSILTTALNSIQPEDKVSTDRLVGGCRLIIGGWLIGVVC